MYPYYTYWDPTYILVVIGAVISMIASANVKRSFQKNSRVYNQRGLRAEQVAEMILRSAGITDVSIRRVSGDLTDHYDPSKKVVNLSDSVYGSTSVSAVGVAAHECGHVIQHARGYVPLTIRTALVPIVNFASRLSMPLILIGLILGYVGLAKIGVVLFCGVLIFQLVMLPVEFDASARAMRVLDSLGILYGEEIKGARKVLTAAALTYVAAVVSTALQVFRLVLLINNRRD